MILNGNFYKLKIPNILVVNYITSFTNIYNPILGTTSAVTIRNDNLYRDTTISLVDGKIYNYQTFQGGNESIYNLDSYTRNLGGYFNLVSLSQNSSHKISIFNKVTKNMIQIIPTFYDDNSVDISFMDDFGQISTMYTQSATSNLGIKFVSKDDQIDIKILTSAGDQTLATSSYSFTSGNNFDTIQILPEGLGSPSNYVEIKKILSNMSTLDGTNFMNGNNTFTTTITHNWG